MVEKCICSIKLFIDNIFIVRYHTTLVIRDHKSDMFGYCIKFTILNSNRTIEGSKYHLERNKGRKLLESIMPP